MASFSLTVEAFYEVIQDIRKMKERGELPGLIRGADEFIVYVMPCEPWFIPHLIP